MNINRDEFRKLLIAEIDRRLDRLDLYKQITPDIIHQTFRGMEQWAPYFAEQSNTEKK